MPRQPRATGCVVFSVDVPDQQTHVDQVNDLFELFDTHRIPATWAVERLQARRVSSHVRESSVDHEVAVLGDASWLPDENNRRTFYRALDERMRDFRDERTRITTLVLNDVDLVDHLDLLVKHRISMVRCRARKGAAAGPCLQPKSLRFGVWQAPPVISLLSRGSAGWWSEMKLRRAIHRCSRQGAIVHLMARVDELLGSRARLRMLEGILALVAEHCQRESLSCLTLQQLARRIQVRPTRVTSQSLLTRAA